jgi:hypothetical protein
VQVLRQQIIEPFQISAIRRQQKGANDLFEGEMPLHLHEFVAVQSREVEVGTAQRHGSFELLDEVTVSVGENGAVLQKIYDCSVESILHELRQGPEGHGFSFLGWGDGLMPAI